jgi:UDP-N-acetylmuramoyl-tripeptide--D-alanyl-D-alanine ligase
LEAQLQTQQLHKLYDLFQVSRGVSIDTRKLEANQIFFALQGPNFDGNQFAQKALDRGAAGVVMDDPGALPVDPSRCWVVDDSLGALQELARHHRKHLECKVVGLTGSNGKTTTKELAARMLSKARQSYATKGNFNNHIGLPLTLLDMPRDTEWAVLELGDNQAGDIQELCRIAAPQLGLITNIGKDHIGFYDDLAANAAGKLELFDYIYKRGGRFLLNADDGWIRQWMGGKDMNVLAYSICDPWASIMGAFTENRLKGIQVRIDFPDGRSTHMSTHLHGSFHLYNIMAACSIAWEAGVTPEQMRDAVEEYHPTNNRSELRELSDGRLLLLDAYNANPTSMQMALENAAEVVEGNWGVVLGEMLELGEHAQTEHKVLGQLVKRLTINPVILIGEAMQDAASEIPDDRVHWFPDTFSARQHIRELLQDCQFILLKGSRNLAVEDLADHLQG